MVITVSQGPAELFASGTAFGLTFHPVWAVAGTVFAALVLWFARRSRWGVTAALSVTVLAWVFGNAADVVRTTGSGLVQAGALPEGAIPDSVFLGSFAVLWVIVGLAVGHAAPLALGNAVGTRVIRGTGWLSAAAVGAGGAWALSLLGDPASTALLGLVL